MITESFPDGIEPKALKSISAGLRVVAGLILACLGGTHLSAQSLGPDFAGAYSIRDLGIFPNELSPWGINIKPGATNVLLFRREGSFTTPNDIAQITLTRDAGGHFSGYSGNVTSFVPAPTASGNAGSVDGSLAFGPGNVILYTSYNDGTLAQIKAGSSIVDRRVNLDEMGYTLGGSLAVVPAGFPGAGRLKILGLPWYDTTLTSDGNGTFNIAPPNIIVPITNYLSGAIYVRAGTPRFTNDSVLITEEAATTVAAYVVNANGDPILESKRSFITGQIANFNGAVYDPSSKDFLFMGFNRHLYVVGSFGVNPLTVAITSPASGASYLTTSPIGITAEATQANGTVSKVSFFNGSNLVETVERAPFGTTLSQLSAGSYFLTAVAYDSSGLSATSSVVRITVTNPATNIPPVVSWANPTNDVSLIACSAILLKANATDPDRIGLPMQKMELFINGTKVGDMDKEAYTFLWADLPIGTYTLTFLATDVDGGTTTSKPIVATVTQPNPNTLVAKLSGPAAPRYPVVCLGGLLGRKYALEASTNFVNWVTVTNIASTNLITQYVDTQSGNFKVRYYRAKFLP